MPFRRITLIAVAALAAGGIGFALPNADPGIRLLFAGDILLSRQVAVEMRRTGRSPWARTAPFLAEADWIAGNLEGAIGMDGECLAGPAAPCFAFPDTTPALLARAGFDAVFVENNHAGDLGFDGRRRTHEVLQSAGVLPLDFEHSPQFTRFGDVTMAVVAITLVRGADGHAQSVPSVAVAHRLRLARALGNLVVVSIHWGTELQDWPSDAQRRAAEWLVDGGADLVIGHHPHVVQRPECVRGRPVFFSLGNHVFDQRYPATKRGLIADCTVRGGRMRCSSVSTRTRHGSATPVVSGAAEAGALAACEVPVAPTLAVAGYALRPEPWAGSSADSGVVIEGWKDGMLRWRSRRAALVTLQPSLAADDDGPLLFALERHPSDLDGTVALRPHVYAIDDHGFVARWRGTALAWPLIDAQVDERGDLCAWHRGDSFIRPDPTVTATRTVRYQWNGFGFSAIDGGREDSTCVVGDR